MLADAEDVEADTVGKLDFLDEVAQAFFGRNEPARRRIGSALDEAVNPDFHSARW
jgi:hypothetical protein